MALFWGSGGGFDKSPNDILNQHIYLSWLVAAIGAVIMQIAANMTPVMLVETIRSYWALLQ
jgi:hypothetical protein